MSQLTKLANGRPCTIRLPGCDGGGPTTVAAHFRSQRIGAGMGIKPLDLFIAFACAPCHSAADNRRQIDGFTRDDIRLMHALAVMETQKWLVDHGYIQFAK